MPREQRKTVVGVIFGGRSVEHDVSIVTANQIIKAFDPEQYEVVPIYITQDGKWYTGDPLSKLDSFTDDVLSKDGIIPVILSPDVRHHGLILNPLAGRLSKSEIKRLDVMFPAIHGSHGEDGTLQGLLELADIPYVGCATLSSALTNDKAMTKDVLRQHNVPVVDDVTFTRVEWLNAPEKVLGNIQNALDFPVFIKPATLGSSIGVSRADDVEMLGISIDMAAGFCEKIMVESAVLGGVEINCSVMGYTDNMRTSVLEQPISWDEFLSFENKYLQGDQGMKSADRIIPAPLEDDLTHKIQQTAIDAFKAVEGRGISRIDFLVIPETNEIYLNEINTMPGSLSFYLWRETDMTAGAVVSELVSLAREAHADKRKNIYDYKTNLVELASSRGVKGAKGTKS